MRKFSVVAAIAIALTGCGVGNGPPNASDLKNALMAQIKSNPMAAAMVESIEDIEILGCKEGGDKPGYTCDYKGVTVMSGGQKMPPAVASARFVKGDNGWLVVQ